MADALEILVLEVAVAVLGWVILWKAVFAANARRERRAEERLARDRAERARATAAALRKTLAHIRETLSHRNRV
jgi:hypothetical protein